MGVVGHARHSQTGHLLPLAEGKEEKATRREEGNGEGKWKRRGAARGEVLFKECY